MADTSLPIDLGDGLRLRQATTADIDALIAFNTANFAEIDGQPEAVASSMADLLGNRGPHPRSSVEQFTIVEDTSSGAIVSSLCLIPQTWSYDGIRIPSTLIEYVSTSPEYRNRGLVRRQFDIVHGWCAERGILLQGISGIPWYYRQFGYEYAIQFGIGRSALRSRLPKHEGDEPLKIRRATASDAAFIATLEEANRDRWLLTSVRDEAIWRYEIVGRQSTSDAYSTIQILERPDGTPVGYVAYAILPGDPPWVVAFELSRSASWLEAVPVVLRHILSVVDEQGDERPEAFATFELGGNHPSYDAMPDVLPPYPKKFGFYLRVADLPAFLMRIAPVLQERLAGSVAHGFSGELPINLYRTGLTLKFDAGKLTAVETGRLAFTVPASLPDLTILQLIFGHRSLAELDDWYPDCRIRTNEARVLLDALFPKQSSFLWPVW